MYKTIKTDFASLEALLNDLENKGKVIYQILPSFECDITLYVVVYKEFTE